MNSYSVTYIAGGIVLKDKGIKNLAAYIGHLDYQGYTIIKVKIEEG